MKISGNVFKTKMEDFAVDLDKVLDDFEQSEGMNWAGPLASSGIRWSLTLREGEHSCQYRPLGGIYRGKPSRKR